MKLLAILLLLLLVSCSSKKHISCINENLYYWEGTYKCVDNWNDGVLIEKRITLKEDYSYNMRVEYVGSGMPIVEKHNGNFKLDGISHSLILYQNEGEDSKETIYKMKVNGFVSDEDDDIGYRKLFSNNLTSDKWYFSTIKDILVDGGNKPETDKCYLKFNNSGIVNGKTSCNSFSGSFDVDEEGIVTISGLVMTYKSCEKPEVRKKYVNFLSQKFRYIIRQDTLEFLDSDDNVIAKFVR